VDASVTFPLMTCPNTIGVKRIHTANAIMRKMKLRFMQANIAEPFEIANEATRLCKQ
jgi:hypothetical protein